MTLANETIDDLLQRAINCYHSGVPTQPFDNPDLSEADAYQVQFRLVDTLRDKDQTVVGHKVALTTKSARAHLGVTEPCFGHMLDRGVYANGSDVPVGELADPHVEAEIAFVLKKDLKGPGITPVDVMRATQAVLPAIELVDLKVQGPGIRAADVIVHNALHGGVVVGSRLTPIDDLDLQFEGVTVEFNGSLHGSGTGFEVMGNPINAICWLANKLAAFDDYLKKGETIISGSIVTPVRVQPGDQIRVTYTKLGVVGASFV
jgi:2-keto-4-pentenoate hydratase